MSLYLGHFVQFFDDNGDPLSGGEVTFYEPGTTTKKDVYTTSALSTPASNPVTLDAAGRATVYLNGDYKVRLEDSTGVLVEETDNINPAITTETTGGNLVANGSFETQGNAATDADGWTLTAQSDGTVERITTDNYDGEAALKFTSLGNGGGQADTDSFFAVSPGRQYEVSFALKCSVADIRNIVQVRYFDKDQSFLSNSSVYDEDTSNPTSWTLKSFSDTPPANARFAKLRILGADQSDATSGEAKFDNVVVRSGITVDTRFPNVNADVTATDEELNKLDGFTGSTNDLNNSIVGTLEGLVDATNGGSNNLTEIDFSSISSSAKRITILFDLISFDASTGIEVQIGDSGGLETSGYVSYGLSENDTSTTDGTITSGFLVLSPLFSGSYSGRMVLSLIDTSNNIWIEDHMLAESTSPNALKTGGGRKALSGTLDRLRITSTSGTDAFNDGIINVLVESF